MEDATGSGASGADDPGAAGVGDPGDGGDQDLDVNAELENVNAELLEGYVAPSKSGKDGEGKAGKKGDGVGAGDGDEDAVALQAYIDKNYGGNRRAFLEAQYRSREESTKLAERLAVLESKQAEPKTPPKDIAAELKARRESHPEVLAIDREIRSIDSTVTNIEKAQVQLAQDELKVSNEISLKEGELMNADPEKQTKLYYELNKLQNRRASIEHKFEVNESRLGSLNLQRRTSARELSRLDKAIKEQLDAEESDSKSRQAGEEAVRGNFDDAVERHLGQYDIDPKSRKASRAISSVRLQLADDLEQYGDEYDGLDRTGIMEVVGELLAEAMADLEVPRIRSSSSGKPTPRPVMTANRTTLSQRAGESSVKRNRQLEEAESNPDFVRKRAQMISERIARKQQSRVGSF